MNALKQGAIHLQPNRLDIAHFAVMARDEFAAENRAARKAAADNRLEFRRKAESAEADPTDVVRAHRIEQLRHNLPIFALPLRIEEHRIEVKADAIPRLLALRRRAQPGVKRRGFRLFAGNHARRVD